MDIERLISARSRSVNGSGIRRVFEIGAGIPDKVDLSIGQPDFPVPRAIKDAAIRAIEEDRNGYPLTRGIVELREALAARLKLDLGWNIGGLPGNLSNTDPGVVVTSGTSGALVLACMALLDDGDEVIIPDPYFVLYPHMAELAKGRAVPCLTYPDFRLTAERVEKLITPRTKMVVLNSPSNPAGVVSSEQECRDLLDLCQRREIVLCSDEIYDEFTFSECRTQPWGTQGSGTPNRSGEQTHRGAKTGLGEPRLPRLACPSPARFAGAQDTVLVVRGFGKTYGVTGWRLGYATGPRRLIEEMTKLQQYLYVSAPHPLQWGVIEALNVDMTPHIAEYQSRRDLVVSTLGKLTEVPMPGGAFYAFVKVPERLGFPADSRAEEFFKKCVEKRVMIVPGRTFSARDTHFRVSFATPRQKLERGLAAIAELMR